MLDLMRCKSGTVPDSHAFYRSFAKPGLSPICIRENKYSSIMSMLEYLFYVVLSFGDFLAKFAG